MPKVITENLVETEITILCLFYPTSPPFDQVNNLEYKNVILDKAAYLICLPKLLFLEIGLYAGVIVSVGTISGGVLFNFFGDWVVVVVVGGKISTSKNKILFY